ncbi:MAG: DUF2586 family protein [Bacteroidales bacterium]
MFNSREYQWSDVKCMIGSRYIARMRSVRYKRSKEKELLYGSGDEPVSIQSGNVSYEGEVAMTRSEYEILAKSGGDTVLDMQVDIVVSYGNPANGDVMVTDKLLGCQFTEEDVYTAIEKAQDLYDWSYETFRPCQIVLEGRGFSAATGTAAADLRQMKDADNNVISCYKVSVCIGQDYNFAETQDAIGKKYADVGTMLGMLASKKVNENIGEVEGGNLMNVKQGLWTKAALSNHKSIAEMDSELQTLEDKGYIFAISYAGLDGVYFNNDHTCTPIIKDKEGYFNEYTISYGRVHDKAVRDLRTALLPKVKSSQPVDSKTGKLPTAIVKYFEAIGDEVFNTMAAEGLITSGKTTVDKDSDLLISPRVLKVAFVIVPMGQIDEIKGTINLKTSI